MVPRGRDTRPTTDRTREALFNILAHAGFAAGAPAGMAVLDVFAGSGALGLEALSRGAVHVAFIDNDAAAVRVIGRNVSDLGEDDHVTVLRRDAVRPGRPPACGPFDLVLMDAPYRAGLSGPALEALSGAGWLCSGACIVVELSVDDELSLPVGFFQHDRRTYGAASLMFLSWQD